MEQKMTTIPFDVELAKKIQAGKHPGKIVTRDGKYEVQIVYWEMRNIYPIIAVLSNNNWKESEEIYMLNGNRYEDGEESDFDLFLQVPEWTQFKDGDVLRANNGVFILNEKGEYKTSFHIGLFFGKLVYVGAANMDNTDEVSYATEEQKQQLIDALKASADPRAKEYIKRFFGIEEVEKKKESEVKSEVKGEFESFQKVLVRDDFDEKWSCDFFSHYSETNNWRFVCVGSSYRFCIPYNDQTKHLLGTKNNWEE